MDHVLVSSIDWSKQHQNRNKNGVFHSGRVSELSVTGIFLLFPKVAQVHTSQTFRGTTERKLAEQIILRHSPLCYPTCQNSSLKEVKKKEGPAKKQQTRKAKEYTSSTLETSWFPFIPVLWHCCSWILFPITTQTTLHIKSLQKLCSPELSLKSHGLTATDSDFCSKFNFFQRRTGTRLNCTSENELFEER